MWISLSLAWVSVENPPTMVRDRLSELQEKSEFTDCEDICVQEHEFNILLNQKQILQDMKQFSEISSWIDDLLQNILDIEVKLFANEENNDDSIPIKYTHMLEENANLCFKIFNAVKKLQEDLDKVRQQQKDDDKEEEGGLVNLVRSTQFDNIKTAYIEAYWKYNAVVRRYEDKISDKSLVVASQEEITTQKQPCEEDEIDHVSDPMLTDHGNSLQSFATIDETRDTLDAVIDRHQELASLEQSLLEMRDLFVLFSTLVMDHGSILNLAEGYVQVASEHVAKAAADCKEARKYYTRSSNCKWLCFTMTHCLSMVLAVLIMIAIFMAVKKFVF